MQHRYICISVTSLYVVFILSLLNCLIITYFSFSLSDMAADFLGHDMNQLHSKFLDGAEDAKCLDCDRTGTRRSEAVDNRYFEALLSKNCTDLEKCDVERSEDFENTPTRDCFHADEVIEVESFQGNSDRGFRDFKKDFQSALVHNVSDVNEKCEDFKSEKICNGKVEEIVPREIKSDTEHQMEENFDREHGSLSYDVTKNCEINDEPCKNSTIREAPVDGELSENFKLDDSVVNESIKNYELVNGESSKMYEMCDTAYGDEEWDSDGHPTGERWPPLGAPNDDEDNQSLYSYPELNW